MSSISLIKAAEVIRGVIFLSTALAELNISFSKFSRAKRKADEEGREFGLADLIAMGVSVEASLDELQQAINESD